MVCTVTYCGKFVNVYLTDRAYGGPEEGGWWYDVGEAIKSVQCRVDDVDRVLAGWRAWCDDENAHRRSDTSSVLSEGRYVACVEDEPASDYPAERPHYE